ncbi:MAG: MBL fold metallo-hydrolase [Betaproteobacteria bacterium]|nr:MBL fold metallo-hydrolase [Betaproteobacteria bacterium]
MNALEHQLHYPLADALPAPAQTLAVAPGIRWVRMPLPFALDHINLWLLQDRIDGQDCWTLIDCGIASDATRALWSRLFDEGLDGLPIGRLLCTHNHPDHVGSAHWLQQRFHAPLWMTIGEYMQARVLSSRLPGADAQATAAHFRRHGIAPGPLLDEIRERSGNHYAALVPAMPEHFRRIRDGETVAIGGRLWRVVVGLGHSSEHAALYCEADGLLISGDMVLPRISTNVSVWELEPEANPVDWYLEALDRFESCREDTLVLPSHGRPFTGLHTRLGQLRAHHAERLEAMMAACRREPHSAAQAVPAMFGRAFDAHQLTFALGETLAHLHSLWYAGRLRREVDADGVVRFAA